MKRAPFERCRDTEDLFLGVESIQNFDALQFRFTQSERPGLIEKKRFCLRERLKYPRTLDDDAIACRPGETTKKGDWCGDQERTRSRDHEHRQESFPIMKEEKRSQGESEGHESEYPIRSFSKTHEWRLILFPLLDQCENFPIT